MTFLKFTSWTFIYKLYICQLHISKLVNFTFVKITILLRLEYLSIFYFTFVNFTTLFCEIYTLNFNQSTFKTYLNV